MGEFLIRWMYLTLGRVFSLLLACCHERQSAVVRRAYFMGIVKTMREAWNYPVCWVIGHDFPGLQLLSFGWTNMKLKCNRCPATLPLLAAAGLGIAAILPLILRGVKK